MRNKPLVSIVCGTRPEIIKLAPVYHALVDSGWADVEWIHTGQHAEMADHMLECFSISPTVRLRRGGSTIQEFSADCRRQLDMWMHERKPSVCVVQGDTESAFLGALSAFYHQVPVAHVEAGLRTFNLTRPFPEEGLRQMISRIAAIHFTPTARADEALRREGVPHELVVRTGNTVVDAQLWARKRHDIRRRVAGRGHVLVTLHRREHWGSEMHGMFEAVADIARANPELEVVFPVHLNPVVRGPAAAVLGRIDNVRLLAPLDYVAMQQALADALLVLTDSGGLQEEAPTWGVPVLVMREETERPEAVEAGCALVVGPSRDAIVRHALRLLRSDTALRRMKQTGNPYGDGRASARINDTLAATYATWVPATAVAV